MIFSCTMALSIKKLASIYLLITVVAGATSVLNKCCASHQQFSEDLTCEEIPSNEREGMNDTLIKWIPQDNNSLTEDINRGVLAGSIVVKYNSEPNCSEHSQDVLFHHEDTFRLQAKDGEIFLAVRTANRIYDNAGVISDVVLFPASSYCVDTAGAGLFAVELCPCSVEMRCARKCCGETGMLHGPSCVDSEGDDIFTSWRPQHSSGQPLYRLPSKIPLCSGAATTSYFNVTSDNNNNLQSRLRLLLGDNIQDLDKNYIVSAEEYCGDFDIATNQEAFTFCVRSDESGEEIVQTVKDVFLIVGAVALCFTVALTIRLPDMRKNIHGKMALCHNMALLVWYVSNGVLFMGPKMSTVSCICISLVLQFSILSAFFWLNIMCVDIAWVFSALRPISSISSQTTRRKFHYYSLYAWGSASVITMITIIVEFTPGVGMKPHFGMANCFFNNRSSQLLFFYGPMALLLVTNVILFVYTITKIVLAKSDSSVLNTGESETVNRKKNQYLILYTKLFFLMGATWMFEVLSWASGGGEIYWLVTDIINLLRGVFIFFIFCWKRTVYREIRGALCGSRGTEPPPPSRTTATTTGATRDETRLELAERNKATAM